MKLIFRDKHNGRFLTPIQVLPNYVPKRLQRRKVILK